MLRINGRKMQQVAEGLWTDGHLTIAKWPVRRDRWHARWVDFMSVKHEVVADTKPEPARELQPYGIELK